MTSFTLNFLIGGLSAISILTACSQANVETVPSKAVKAVETITVKTDDTKADGFHYMFMDGFSQDMARFIGLTPEESFASAETKINAVFKAYDGHDAPLDIGMESEIVEAGWKQVLVTQNGVIDGAVSAQQLLAVFDAEQKLVTYGIRIKCHSDNDTPDWQNTSCE